MRLLAGFLMGLLAFVIEGGSYATSPDRQIEKKLAKIWQDDFSQDTSFNYEVDGKVLWKNDRCVISPGGSISRTVKFFRQSKLVFNLADLEEASDNNSENLDARTDELDALPVNRTLLMLHFANGEVLLINLVVAVAEGKVGSAISLAYLNEEDGEVASEFINEQVLADSIHVGLCEIVADSGYVQFLKDGKTVINVYSPRLDSSLAALSVIQQQGDLGLASLELHAVVPRELDAANELIAKDAEEKLGKALELYGHGRKQKAFELTDEGVQLLKGSVGSDHTRYHDALDQLLAFCLAMNHERYPLVLEERYEVALQTLGEFHPASARFLHQIASIHYEKGDFGKALNILHKNRQIISKTLGVYDTSYAVALESIDQCASQLADHKTAYEALVELLRIQSDLHGEESDELCEVLLRLGSCNFMLGKRKEAESMLQQVKSIRRQTLNGGFLGFFGSDQGGQGVVVVSVEDGGPCDMAGILPGDVIVEIEGQRIGSLETLGELAGSLGPGAALKVGLRRTEANTEATLVLGEHPLHAEANQKLADFYTRVEDYKSAAPLLIEIADISKAVSGDKSDEYARAIKNLSNLYSRTLQYAKSQEKCLEWYAIKKPHLAQQPATADLLECSEVLTRLGWAAKNNRELDLCLSSFEKSAAIIQNVKGEDDPEFATCLQNVAHAYLESNDFDQARKYFDLAIKIHQRADPNSDACAESLRGRSAALFNMGDYELAKEAIHNAVDIIGDGDTSAELGFLANIHLRQGNYDQAKSVGVQAWSRAQQVLGPNDPTYLTRLHDLAIIYIKTGDFANAKSRLEEALHLAEKILGQGSEIHSIILGTLGELFREQGEYVKALRCFHLAGDSLKGQNPEHYSNVLNNMAMTYIGMGNTQKSISLFMEATKIKGTLYGEDHPDYSVALNNVALMLGDSGQLDLQRKYLQVAADIKKRVLGVEHPSYAISLNNLANNARQREDYVEAIELFSQSVDITKSSLGEQHPTYATCLFNLGLAYFAKGDYQNAEGYFLHSQEIRKRILGSEHPETLMSIRQLAKLYWLIGKSKQAKLFLRQSFQLSYSLATRYAAGQSQGEQLRYAEWLQDSLHKLLSFSLNSDTPPDPSLYSYALNWKGMTLLRQRKYRHLAEVHEADPVLKKLEQVTRQLSAQLRSVPKEDGIQTWSAKIAALTENRDRLESELARINSNSKDAGSWIDAQELLSQLAPDTVLIDFLCLARTKVVDQDGIMRFYEKDHVAVFISSPDADPILLDLGSEQDLSDSVAKWRKSMLGSDQIDLQTEIAGRKVREVLWEPILPYLKDSRTIILSSDGVLGRVSFAALPGREKGTFLIEDHRLACVPVPRLLTEALERSAPQEISDGKLLLVGDVDYDSLPSGERIPSPSGVTAESETQPRFPPLTQTASEIKSIRDLFLESTELPSESVTMLTKKKASEAEIRAKTQAHQYVHFATHGFFADPANKPMEFFGDADEAASHLNSQLNEFVQGYSPGQLSGLVLAGANVQGSDTDDGILTSDEISYLALSQVELVVLSACETGLGPVAGGEGLLGVQRAFQVSGVGTVVASLWSVDDLATRRLMERFYRNLFVENLNRLDALREAQLWMLKNPDSVASGQSRGEIVRLKQPAKTAVPNKAVNNKRTSPRFWAAFSLSGDWR